MVEDIGGGTTEVGVISLGGMVYKGHRCVRVGGDKFDEAIINYIRRNYGMLIGEPTAERPSRRTDRSRFPGSEVKEMEVKGRNLRRRAAQFTISVQRDPGSLTDPLNQIVSACQERARADAAELGADIAERGMMLTGGGALLRDLDRLLAERNRPAGAGGRGPADLRGARLRHGAGAHGAPGLDLHRRVKTPPSARPSQADRDALGTLDGPAPVLPPGAVGADAVVSPALALFLMVADARFKITRPVRAATGHRVVSVERMLLVPVAAGLAASDYLIGQRNSPRRARGGGPGSPQSQQPSRSSCDWRTTRLRCSACALR